MEMPSHCDFCQLLRCKILERHLDRLEACFLRDHYSDIKYVDIFVCTCDCVLPVIPVFMTTLFSKSWTLH